MKWVENLIWVTDENHKREIRSSGEVDILETGQVWQITPRTDGRHDDETCSNREVRIMVGRTVESLHFGKRDIIGLINRFTVLSFSTT